ncbi:2-keto-4-pentenoate hydratase [Pseudomonas sp. WHRI 8822A]|uniref:2-keto-4-pentenoate hydratase n=1 Tax=Pseudomonas sp. WHRI 8822A TaxID=3162568 RepID=UPI0032ED90E9
MSQANLAQRLLQAAREQVPLPREQGDGLGLAAGYELQRLGVLVREARHERLSGWKVAFAGAAAQRRFGLSEPVYGALTDAMAVAEGQTVDLAGLIQPKLEIELAVVMGQDLNPGFYSDEALLAAIGEVAAAFEIADCRWQGWGFEAGAFVADNSAAAAYCLSARQPFDVRRHAQVEYRLMHEGHALGCGLSSLGDESPLSNTCWLIRRLLADGHRLSAGQIILSGALLPPIAIEPGCYRLGMLGMELALQFQVGRGPESL